MLDALQQSTQEELVHDNHALSPEEAAVVGLLQQRLQQASAATGRGKKQTRKRA